MSDANRFTASHVRHSGWKALSNSHGWFVAMFGIVVAAVASTVVNKVYTLLTVPYFSAPEFFEKLRAGAFDSNLPRAYAVAFAVIAGSVLVSLWMQAVFGYGNSAVSLGALRGRVSVGQIFSGFGRGWRTMWLLVVWQTRVLFFLLLFVVPGIMAMYSYRMFYYVRIDRPQLPASKCLAESARLMYGHRWRLFCLDLSFLGWSCLAVLSCGLLIPFVMAYALAAHAAFYEQLLDLDEHSDSGERGGND